MKKLINLNFNGKIDETNILSYRLRQFPCCEFEFSIQEDISNCDIEIYQSFEVGKFNDDLMKLQIVCDVLKRNNVASINYFAPFLPYTRQDRTCNTTGSLGVKLMAEIINNCKINKITTYDFHASQIESFFKGQVYNFSAIPLFLDDINKKFGMRDIVIVFPDAGAYSRFKQFFEGTDYDIAIINKTRSENGLKMKLLGDVFNKTAIIIDDMIDSGGTVITAAKLLKEHRANGIFVYSTHGILSGNAVENLTDAEIEKITITNSLVQNQKLSEKFEILKL